MEEMRHNLVLQNFLSIWKGKTSASSVARHRPKPKSTVRIRTFKLVDDWTSSYPNKKKSSSEEVKSSSSEADESEAVEKRKNPLEERISRLTRFGPTYAKDTEPNKLAKDSAWQHILRPDKDGKNGIESSYFRLIKEMEKEIVECYDDTSFEKKLKRGPEFRKMMARDGCFFVQLSLHILGAGDILGYPSQHPYFGTESNPTDVWIPDMFFVGNQIPYMVINALMKQPYFQGIIKEGVDKGRWKRPPSDDLAKLALYLTVVQPHLESPSGTAEEPSPDILQTLHNLILRSDSDIIDPTYHEMREFRDLEANYDGKDVQFPSAGDLYKRGVRVVRGKPGISNIRFENWGYSAFIYLPPFTIDAHTEHLLTGLANHELSLSESDREFTAYLRLMRDLSRNYKDFKILEKKGIILVKGEGVKNTMVRMLDDIVSRHNSNYTLNFCQVRRQIKDYGGPPWCLISVCFSLLTVVQAIITILAYCIPRG